MLKHLDPGRAPIYPEAELPAFRTVVDGQPVGFLHVRSPEPNARPLLVHHAWLGSVAEMLALVEPLTHPRLHGGRAADACHVVWPSVGEVDGLGRLMSRLGYERFDHRRLG
jgi:hypothetical protein